MRPLQRMNFSVVLIAALKLRHSLWRSSIMIEEATTHSADEHILMLTQAS